MAGTCGAPMMGGRTRKTRKVRKSRKLRGGMGYGFGGSTIGTSGAQWDSSWGGEVTKAGEPVTDTADPQRGSSRRRRVKKSKSKSKSRRSRKMKGGAAYQSVGTVGASFTGQGSRGLADYTGYASKAPSGGPVQNPDGAYKP